MTLRERILAVYRGETPDVVPFMLDLSHWFYHRNHLPWDISRAYPEPEEELIAYHRENGVGFYVANLASFYSVDHAPGVTVTTERGETGGQPEIRWRVETPSGSIQRTRIWSEQTYAWAINSWGVSDADDMRTLAESFAGRRFTPHWDRYRKWCDAVGDVGVVYMTTGYSGVGHLMNYWMGVEETIYASVDMPDALAQAVETINASQLELVDLLCEGPGEVVIMGDNLSSDIQPPAFFDRWSRPFYVEAIGRLHAAGKCAALHIDGRLRGAIDMVRRTGADCGDAITPRPLGDLTAAECRQEAGPDFILSGGVSPDIWLPDVPVDTFKEKVVEWLDLRKESPRLIAAAGDQVPPGADENRIVTMRDLVQEYGRY